MGLPDLTQFSSAYEHFVYSESFSLFLSLFLMPSQLVQDGDPNDIDPCMSGTNNWRKKLPLCSRVFSADVWLSEQTSVSGLKPWSVPRCMILKQTQVSGLLEVPQRTCNNLTASHKILLLNFSQMLSSTKALNINCALSFMEREIKILTHANIQVSRISRHYLRF